MKDCPLEPKLITSVQNQRVKDAAKLRDRRQRAKQGRTLIDGVREIARAIDAGIELDEVFICEPRARGEECEAVVRRACKSAAHAWQVTPEVFEKLAFGDRAEGVVAVAIPRRLGLADLNVQSDALVAVLDRIEKPGNVGAILRTADGAGVSAVIVTDPASDLYNPNCIRASLGTLFTLQVCESTAADAIAWLSHRDFQILAARVDAEKSYTDVDYHPATAIVLGSEADGLSAAWSDPRVTGIKLPMQGAADSLNVAATAAVLFYEALRQRRT